MGNCLESMIYSHRGMVCFQVNFTFSYAKELEKNCFIEDREREMDRWPFLPRLKFKYDPNLCELMDISQSFFSSFYFNSKTDKATNFF